MLNAVQTGWRFGRKTRIAIWVLWGFGVVWAPLVAPFVRGWEVPGYELPVDLQVYQNGGIAWLRGLPLYHDFPGTLGGLELPFTYPPIAAVLFSSFSISPPWLVGSVFAVASFVALTAAAAVIARLLTGNQVWTIGAAVAVGSLTLEPVLASLKFGQVNLFLMAMIVVDCLALRRFRGTLVGVAAAIKLTPAVFVLYFLLRRDWRAAATSMAALVGATLLGFLFAPADSAEYWFHTVLDTGRAGALNYAMNQSLRGMLHRLPLEASVELLLWVLLCAIVVALVWRISLAVQNKLTVLLSVAVVGLLVSPVSWSHHWVWIAPILLSIGVVWLRSRDIRWLLALIIVWWIAYVAPFELLPHAADLELHWALWQQLPGNAYILLGLGFLLTLAFSPQARNQLESALERPRVRSDLVGMPLG